MPRAPLSRIAVLLALSLGACAETRVSDRPPVAMPTTAATPNRTLLVVETALPADTPERDTRAAEVVELTRSHLAPRMGAVATPASDEVLAAEARHKGLESVSVVRIEDYARRGNLHVALALPPVSWDTRTEISVRLRVIDARTGTTTGELRRDRVRGGLFTLRSPKDLPSELTETLDSLFPES